IESARLLMASGASVSSRYNHNMTPWQLASAKGHEKLASIIREFEALELGEKNA
ncbi:MAG: hypothetical protein IIB38_15865, partial [Candidatus Hydrogenedentes bacterium]|nr:hypothetical protein [Candidatus Hydrogenedentota bacterium]